MWNRPPWELPRKIRGNTPTCLPLGGVETSGKNRRLIILYYYNFFVCGLILILFHDMFLQLNQLFLRRQGISCSAFSYISRNQLM